MLPANLISALQALSRSDRPQVSSAANAPNPAVKIEPGQQFQGSVQARISEGVFNVQVAGQTIQMRLPGNIQSGDVLKLEVISTRPKITFSIIPSTNPLATHEQISAAAQILSDLAELPIERAIQQLGSKAVWQAEQHAPDAQVLAGALREALGKSGLFYESHQAQWVRGERSTDQLLEEPQNVLTGKTLAHASAEQASAMSKSASDAPLSIAKELLPLVQQQLHTLEHHHLVWMGQVWPGQQMQWEIQGEPGRQHQHEDERQWSTEVELVLPQLGNVHAHLVLAESGLSLTLHAADPSTVELFNRALPSLRNSLADANLALTAAVVEKS